MRNDNLTTMVYRLADLTKDNKIVWKLDQKLEAFVLPSVSIDGCEREFRLSLSMQHNGSYRLCVVGADGLVESSTVGNPLGNLATNDNNPLAFLYVTVMKQVLDNDTVVERLKGVLGALEGVAADKQ